MNLFLGDFFNSTTSEFGESKISRDFILLINLSRLKMGDGAKGIESGVADQNHAKIKEASLEIGKSCSRCHRLYRDYQLKIEKKDN